MRKILSLLIILGMAVTTITISKSAEAATTDTFNITVTISYLEITLKDSTAAGAGADYTAWALGTKAVSTVTTMVSGATGGATEGIYVEVGNSSAYKLTGQITSGCDWTAGTSDTTAADTYLLAMQGAATATVPADMTVAGAATAMIEASATDIANATGAAATDIYLYCSHKTPTSTTFGTEQSITVTITIVAT